MSGGFKKITVSLVTINPSRGGARVNPTLEFGAGYIRIVALERKFAKEYATEIYARARYQAFFLLKITY